MEEKRRRILAAARELILSDQALTGFSVEAVARRAGVARATVYNLFDARAGLLAALFDALAQTGGMQKLAQVFQIPDPHAALDAFIQVFGDFWSSDRLLIRRLHALAVLDPSLQTGEGDRNQWRRKGLQRLLGRLQAEAQLDLLYSLTSFECFDRIAGDERSPAEVVPEIQRAARRLLGV